MLATAEMRRYSSGSGSLVCDTIDVLQNDVLIKVRLFSSGLPPPDELEHREEVDDGVVSVRATEELIQRNAGACPKLPDNRTHRGFEVHEGR
jgi:hypothetical protein